MRRRELLGVVGAAAAATAGCVGGSSDGGDRSKQTPTVAELPLAERGFPSTICETEILPGIRAIDEPAFGTTADWPADDDPYGPLTDDEEVIGVTADGTARAYPVSVILVHEVVNDHLGGPLLVTFCSLCSSGMVAERTVDGEATIFGVSGQLWRPPRVYAGASEAEGRVFAVDGEEVRTTGNLVMYDEATGSYWSQLLARAICGPERGTGLTIRPSNVTTWGEWRADHDDAEVLLPPPASGLLEPPG